MDKNPVAPRRRRVLHVVGKLDRGGVETWLMHVLRHIDHDQFQMDFLVHLPDPGVLDEQARGLGAGIWPCPHINQPMVYARQFKSILQEHGPYDVVHSHVHHFSGYVLRLAEQCGVPTRIAHSHSDTSRLQKRVKLPRRLYLRLMKHWVHRHASLKIAASEQAGAALYGPGWQQLPHHRLLYCAINLEAFQGENPRRSIRTELGLHEKELVVVHVGSFNAVKNHTFLVRIFKELHRRRPDSRLLLVGDGPLRAQIEHQVADAGLIERVVFAGLRSDVPELLRAADVYLMPSLYEGLPLSGLEAQAAGLPCVLSDTITPEVDVVPELVKRLSLHEPPEAWAAAILALCQSSLPGQATALAALEASPFNIHVCVRELEEIYRHEA